jgi:hypothetical protein
MSFNRIKYDNGAYDLQMSRSTAPGDYRLYAPYGESCEQCYSYSGPIGSKSDVSLVKKQNDLTFKDMANIESQLSWRNNKLSKTNEPLNSIENNNLQHKPSCSEKLTPEDTRFTHPIDNYRGMSLTELMLDSYLHINPQCSIQESGDRIGLNSRLQSKDTYKLTEQEFWDKGDAFPKQIPSANKICDI